MIEVLNGIKETVLYEGIEGFKLHDNTNFEAYPEHWHTPIEIIMPLKNYYNVSNKTEFFYITGRRSSLSQLWCAARHALHHSRGTADPSGGFRPSA